MDITLVFIKIVCSWQALRSHGRLPAYVHSTEYSGPGKASDTLKVEYCCRHHAPHLYNESDADVLRLSPGHEQHEILALVEVSFLCMALVMGRVVITGLLITSF